MVYRLLLTYLIFFLCVCVGVHKSANEYFHVNFYLVVTNAAVLRKSTGCKFMGCIDRFFFTIEEWKGQVD